MEQIRLPKHTVDAIERRWSSRFDRPRPGTARSTVVQLMRLRAHQGNIRRYRRLLQTKLTDLERRFIETRLQEEHAALERLSQSGDPRAPVPEVMRKAALPRSGQELQHE
jgi:hypothetical protein